MERSEIPVRTKRFPDRVSAHPGNVGFRSRNLSRCLRETARRPKAPTAGVEDHRVTNTRFSLRRGRSSDAQALWAIRADAVRRTCRSHYSGELVERWAASPLPETFSTDIEHKHVVVAVAGRGIAGFAILNPAIAEIEAVYVAPDHGRRGLGRQLLAHLEAAASGSGLRKLSLSSSLNAVPFHAASGYKAVSQGFYTTSAGVEIACVRMEKPLDCADSRRSG